MFIISYAMQVLCTKSSKTLKNTESCIKSVNQHKEPKQYQ